MAAAGVIVHAAVVRQGGESGLPERVGGFLDLLARAAVDDAGFAFVLTEEIQQLAARVERQRVTAKGRGSGLAP